MGYELLDHTADLALRVWAPTVEELFAEGLRGFTDCLTERASVKAVLSRTFELEAAALDLLLVDWLSEILFVFETEGVVLCSADVTMEICAERGYRLKARAAGELFDPGRHGLKIPIKAVTYHGLSVVCRPSHAEARVIFDV